MPKIRTGNMIVAPLYAAVLKKEKKNLFFVPFPP